MEASRGVGIQNIQNLKNENGIHPNSALYILIASTSLFSSLPQFFVNWTPTRVYSSFGFETLYFRLYKFYKYCCHLAWTVRSLVEEFLNEFCIRYNDAVDVNHDKFEITFDYSFLAPPTGKESVIVGCRGVIKLGGLVPGYPQEVPLRLRLVSLLLSVFWEWGYHWSNLSVLVKAVIKMMTGCLKNYESCHICIRWLKSVFFYLWKIWDSVYS